MHVGDKLEIDDTVYEIVENEDGEITLEHTDPAAQMAAALDEIGGSVSVSSRGDDGQYHVHVPKTKKGGDIDEVLEALDTRHTPGSDLQINRLEPSGRYGGIFVNFETSDDYDRPVDWPPEVQVGEVVTIGGAEYEIVEDEDGGHELAGCAPADVLADQLREIDGVKVLARDGGYNVRARETEEGGAFDELLKTIDTRHEPASDVEITRVEPQASGGGIFVSFK